MASLAARSQLPRNPPSPPPEPPQAKEAFVHHTVLHPAAQSPEPITHFSSHFSDFDRFTMQNGVRPHKSPTMFKHGSPDYPGHDSSAPSSTLRKYLQNGYEHTGAANVHYHQPALDDTPNGAGQFIQNSVTSTLQYTPPSSHSMNDASCPSSQAPTVEIEHTSTNTTANGRFSPNFVKTHSNHDSTQYGPDLASPSKSEDSTLLSTNGKTTLTGADPRLLAQANLASVPELNGQAGGHENYGAKTSDGRRQSLLPPSQRNPNSQSPTAPPTPKKYSDSTPALQSNQHISTVPNTPINGTRTRPSLSSRRDTRSIQGEDELYIRRTSRRRRRRDDDEEDQILMGTKVDQNHVNWVTAYNMLTGIRYTVSLTNAKMDRELTAADFTETKKLFFDITGNELTPSAKYDFKFKDYSPWVFRHLRKIFNIDPADYLVSLTSKYILSELGSPGKSGSFFYFSRDYKYIIKTIHHGEHRFLRKILHQYYEHVQKNPNTLISQFYGLHRVKLPYGRKIHFVVMNNLFPPHRDIHQTFDLKGSTIGREYPEHLIAEHPRATLKDINWMSSNRHLELGPSRKAQLVEQLKKDVKFLQDSHVMDYSLLIGIHDLGRGNNEQLRDKTLKVFHPVGEEEEGEEHAESQPLKRTQSAFEHQKKARALREKIRQQRPVPISEGSSRMPDEIGDIRSPHIFYQDDGGLRATNEDDSFGDEIYYLGIIDCLTHYGIVKRMEHFIKGLTKDEKKLSAIPPMRYGERFLNFMTGITMSKERADKIEREQGQSLLSPVERIEAISSVPATPGQYQRRRDNSYST